MNKVKFYELKVLKQNDNVITAYLSTKDVDRENESILPEAWVKRLTDKSYPLVDSHDYSKVGNQIGIISNLRVDDKGLIGDIEYFVGKGNFEADWAYYLATQGLANFSVGFIAYDSEVDAKTQVLTYKDVELLEASQVLVPANPNATQIYLNAIKSFKLQEGKEGKEGKEVKEFKEVSDMELKGVIPYKDLGKADEGEAWDAATEVKNATVEDLKLMCLWYDETKPDIKSSYKLPHHHASGHAAVWKGCAAAMAAILGARGGVNLSEADRRGAYDHDVKHYKDFNKEPPDFKTYQNDDEIFKACEITAKEFDGYIKAVEIKAGRVLSEKNRTLIKYVLDDLDKLSKNIGEVVTPLKELYDVTGTNTESLDSGDSEFKEVWKALANKFKK